MAYQQITVTLEAAAVAGVDAVLRLAGALSIVLEDAADNPVLEPAPGALEIWPQVRLSALFDAAVDADRLVELVGNVSDGTAIRIERISESDWIDGWRQAVRPITIGERLRIVSPDDPTADRGDPLLLNMGLAFGTGQHPTTRLCLEWLAESMPDAARVLDFGCGSGILALAALKLGAAHAYATDNDEQALTAAADNAQLNGLTDRLRVGAPESVPADRFDVVLANILAGTLITLADRFAACQPAGGRLVLSGVLAAQAESVVAAMMPLYENFEIAECEGWVRIAAHRSVRSVSQSESLRNR